MSWKSVSSVTQSCLTLCDTMDCSTPHCPVHHQLPQLTQTYVHRVGDAIQPSHPRSSPFLPAFNLSQHRRPLFFPPSTFHSIGVFSNESVLRIRWPKYWSLSFSISPPNEYSMNIPLGLTGLISLLSKGLLRVFSRITDWNNQFFGFLPSLWSNSHICTWLLQKP